MILKMALNKNPNPSLNSSGSCSFIYDAFNFHSNGADMSEARKRNGQAATEVTQRNIAFMDSIIREDSVALRNIEVVWRSTF
jgi:hypothetical protein